jgi:hypothetical protein
MAKSISYHHDKIIMNKLTHIRYFIIISLLFCLANIKADGLSDRILGDQIAKERQTAERTKKSLSRYKTATVLLSIACGVLFIGGVSATTHYINERDKNEEANQRRNVT